MRVTLALWSVGACLGACADGRLPPGLGGPLAGGVPEGWFAARYICNPLPPHLAPTGVPSTECTATAGDSGIAVVFEESGHRVATVTMSWRQGGAANETRFRAIVDEIVRSKGLGHSTCLPPNLPARYWIGGGIHHWAVEDGSHGIVQMVASIVPLSDTVPCH